MYWQYWLARALLKSLGDVQAMTRHEFDGWFVFFDIADKRAGEGLK